jgi:hypothetical protein
MTTSPPTPSSCCNISTGYCFQTYGPCGTDNAGTPYTQVDDCNSQCSVPPWPSESGQPIDGPKVLCYFSDPNYGHPCYYVPGNTCPDNAKQITNCNEGYPTCCNAAYTDSTNTILSYSCTEKVNGGCPAGASPVPNCTNNSSSCTPGTFEDNYFCCYPDNGVCCDDSTFKINKSGLGVGCIDGGIPMTNCFECAALKNKQASITKKSRVMYGTVVDSCGTGSYCKWWQCPATCQGSGAACSVSGQKYSCPNGTCYIDSNGQYDNCCDACNPPPTPPPPTPPTDTTSFMSCCQNGNCAPATCPAGSYAQPSPILCCQNGKCFGGTTAGCPQGSSPVENCNKCYQHCCGPQVVNNKMINVCSPKTAAGCPVGTTSFVEDCSQCTGFVENLYCCHPDLGTCCPYKSPDGSCPYGGIPTLDCTLCPYLKYPTS